MESTYVNIMIQSLHKKVKVLEEIKRLNQLQKSLLEDDRASVDEFDKTVESKSVCIHGIPSKTMDEACGLDADE